MNHNPDFERLTSEQKRNLLQQLVKMAKADHVFKFVEMKYLTEIAELLSIPPTELDEILEADVKLKNPENFADRTRQLYRLSIMMMIDHIITKEEMIVLKNYAIELSLPPEGVEVMLKKMNENKGGMLLEHDLFEIFRIQSN